MKSVIVVGAGALGTACVFALSRAGWRVTLVDDGRSSASAVAAGMLAPAFESALDDADATRAALLLAARDLWPEIAQRSGVALIRDGARWSAYDKASAAAGRRLAKRMSALGFAVEGAPDSPYTPDDWRLDPEPALAALAAGATRLQASVAAAGAGADQAWATLSDGRRLAADRLVLASGVGRIACPEAEPAFSAVRAIKGQIVAAAAPPPSCVLRTPGAYITPKGGAVLVGATMQFDARDAEVDAGVTAALLEAAARAWPPLREAGNVSARAGVRGATPDGLPLAGLAAPRVAVALAPRRNGWLLAPLVGRIVAAYCCGTDPGPHAAAFDPLRFARP